MIVCVAQILCTQSFFGAENYASCNKHTKMMMTGSKRDSSSYTLDKDNEMVFGEEGESASNSDVEKQNWRKRKLRSAEENKGRVDCQQWGSCIKGALFALQNFKYGFVDHAENAIGCKFTFNVCWARIHNVLKCSENR